MLLSQCREPRKQLAETGWAGVTSTDSTGKATQSFPGKAMPADAVVGWPLFLSVTYSAPGVVAAAVDRPRDEPVFGNGWPEEQHRVVRQDPRKSICVKPASGPLQSAVSIVPRKSKNPFAATPVRVPANVTTA